MKRSPLFGLLAIAIASTTACVPRHRSTATAATVAGTAAAVLGTVWLAELKSPGDDTNGNGRDDFNENELECILGGCVLAMTMIVGGLIAAGAGLIGLSQTAEAKPAPGPQVPMPTANPRPVQTVDPRIVAPLPELPASEETLRLAQQTRAAARHGHCDAARVTVERIRAHDERYARELVTGPVMAPCTGR